MSGFALTALFIGFLVYPLMSEILCIAHIKEGVLNDITLIDKASGLFCLFFGFGCIVAILFANIMMLYIKPSDPD